MMESKVNTKQQLVVKAPRKQKQKNDNKKGKAINWNDNKPADAYDCYKREQLNTTTMLKNDVSEKGL